MTTGGSGGKAGADALELHQRLAELEAAADKIRRELGRSTRQTSGPGRAAGKAASPRGASKEDLQRANALLEAQLESSASGILIVDLKGTVVARNRRFFELWDLPLEMAEERTDDTLLDKAQAQLKDPAGFLTLLNQIYADPLCERRGDLIELKSGRVLSRNTYPVRLTDGTVIGRAWDFADHTELRATEEQLRLTQYSVDHASDYLFWIDSESRFFSVNRAACRALGYTREELLRLRVWDISPEVTPDNWHEEWESLRRLKKKVSETRHRRKDGSKFPVEVTRNYLRFHDQEYLCVFVRDLSERRRAEAKRRELELQIQHAQKLESLGVLAGGIAHDFNNLLGGVLGHVSLGLMQLKSGHPIRPYLEEAEKAAQRAAELASQMLAYSGRGKFVIETIDLNEVIGDMAHLLESSTSKKARLELRLARTAPRLEGDPTQIRQVILNLVTNASDALGSSGGTIQVATEFRTVDRAYIRKTYLDEEQRPGRYASLEVTDDGCGMDESTRERIFDPFFSTKETGHGLGMAAVLGIVRSHKGLIEVATEPGRGTTFRILFPVEGTQPVPVQHPPAEVPDSPCPGGGTVLVVDDEETIRLVAERSLVTAGFDTLMAEDGNQAVEVFRRHRDRIAAILLDLSMPELDGVETLREIQKLRPDVRVLMSSGYNEQERIQALSSPYVDFLKKPYRPKELAAKIRALLEA